MTRRPTLLVALTLVALALLAACSSPSGPGPAVSGAPAELRSPSPGPAVTASDWTTYHRTADRAGRATGVPRPTSLRRAWQADLDGAVYGQPLVLGDLVIVATEQDSVYGLALADGSIRWRRSLGTPMTLSDLPCGNIDPLGITGTPAYDRSTGAVFVVAEVSGARHELVSLDVATGAVRFTRNLDISGRDRHAEQQRGALAVAGGRVYVPFGGLAGDCGNYVGYVSGVPVDGRGATVTYRVPTAREGGIWAPSGIAVSGNGDIWAAVGNGASLDHPYDGSDSVLRLSADLSKRLDFFAPSSWGAQNADDLDLGTTGPLLLPALKRVLISGKDGSVYLLDAARLGGIGGQLAQVGACRGFGGMAWDAAAGQAFVPCTEGLLQVRVTADALSPGWRAPAQVTGSPVLGGGAVWSLDPGAGRLYALAESDGKQLASADVGVASRFASPVLTGARVLTPTLAGVTALTIS